jgi:ABC-type amino acid transport substrate-binding protein
VPCPPERQCRWERPALISRKSEVAGASIRKGDTALAEEFNAALSTLAKGGKLDEISDSHGLTGLIITPRA